MKKQILSILAAITASALIPVTTSAEMYDTRWESLLLHKTPEWFEDAKFGIFIHWGVYSVPAYNGVGFYAEWYARDMYREIHDSYQHHRENHGVHGEFGYADFIKDFTAEKWDPEDWADLFARCGAKLVVPVGEHHDGFAMWDSKLTEWDAKDMGPKRDIIGELGKAVRARGLKYAPSYHRERHFAYYLEHDREWIDGKPFPGVQKEIEKNPNRAGLYGPFEFSDAFMADYKARWDEICAKYQPDMMWLDGINVFNFHPRDPQVIKFQDTVRVMVSEYLNNADKWGKEVAVNNKGKGPNFPLGFGLPEQDYKVTSDILPGPWVSSRGMGRSYGINQVEEKDDLYPSVDELIEHLVDVVSKNGFFLLNIGPAADGTITESQRSRLEGMGKWLDVNGEAIFGTRPWKTYGKDNYRYTTKGDDLYVIALSFPGMYMFLDPNLIPFEKDTKVIWLDGNHTLNWRRGEHQAGEGILVKLPYRKSTDPADPLNAAYVFKIVGGAK